MPTITTYAQGTPCWVELQTPDQRAAGSFYRTLFGWHLDEVPVDEQGHVYLAASLQGDAVAGIGGQPPGAAGRPGAWGVYLAVDDVDAVASRVAGAGGTLEAGPFDVQELGRMAAIQDPTGARVNLWQARSHRGTARANEPGTPIWNELTSPDLETATRFYTDVLGVAWERMGEEDYLGLVVDGRTVGGAMAPPAAGIPPHWNVYFNVVSVDETVAQALALGGTVVVPAFDVEGVGRMAFLADPQGAMFALMAGPAGD